MKKHYINAVLSLLQEGRDLDVVLQNLELLLKQKGHSRLHGEILKGVLAQLETSARTQAPLVVLAKESDAALHDASIKEALIVLGASEKPVITTDQTIVGGYIASFNSKRINASYKDKLVALYRSITA